MLVLLGSSLVSLIQVITGSGLNRFIVKHVFTVERQKSSLSQGSKIEDELNSRQPASFKLFHCLQSRRHERRLRLFEKAIERVDSQFDLINFIQQQMSRLIERRLIFTKVERFLIMKQRDPFVLTNRKDQSLSDDSKTNYKELSEYVDESDRGKHYDSLLRGLFPAEVVSPDTQRQDLPKVQMKMRSKHKQQYFDSRMSTRRSKASGQLGE